MGLKDWGLIGLLVALLGMGDFAWWNQTQVQKMEDRAVAAETRASTAEAANAEQDAVITQLLTSQENLARYVADSNRIVERHYVTERTIQAEATAFQQEREDANLEDGALSPDMRFVLRWLRDDYAARHPAGPSGDGASPGPAS